MDFFIQYNEKAVTNSEGQNDILVTPESRRLDHSELSEHWLTIKNCSESPIRIHRVDTVNFTIPKGNYELMYYTSGWGLEFESIREPLVDKKTLFNRTGRSSQGMNPWFSLFKDDGEVITGTVMWSGNWIIRFEPEPDGGFRISAGLDDWEFFKDLQPGESMASPHFVIAYGQNGDLNETSIPLARAGRTMWYPKNLLSSASLVEWNQWWSYEDKFVDEDNFMKNVDMAKQVGFDLCTLDAGWFGPADPSTHWYDYRGDWDLVNSVRFPSGIRTLSDYVHEKGLKFGLWCEIEALGQYAQLGVDHPEFAALRDGERLGYVCFGNPQVQEWAYATLDRLITEYQCDWIKLDFNVDPGAGCNRTDHGHGAGDGLYEHYQGYYNVLTRIRKKHPHVILENCSSGGLRLDLGLMSQTHTAFLSDPDWPEHNLQLFWGASTMFAPNICLHWGYSEWITEHTYQKFNPQDPKLTVHLLDYYVMTSMLGGIGFSQKLPDLPEWILKRYELHAYIYKTYVRKFISHADLYRLTDQPRRFGKGSRWAAFQYSMPDQTEHLLFVFRLHNSKAEETIYLKSLRPEREYKLVSLLDGEVGYYTGSQLMENGLKFSELREEESNLFLIL